MTNIGLINMYKAKRFAHATNNKCHKINNIYKDEELSENSTCAKIAHMDKMLNKYLNESKN